MNIPESQLQDLERLLSRYRGEPFAIISYGVTFEDDASRGESILTVARLVSSHGLRWVPVEAVLSRGENMGQPRIRYLIVVNRQGAAGPSVRSHVIQIAQALGQRGILYHDPTTGDEKVTFENPGSPAPPDSMVGYLMWLAGVDHHEVSYFKYGDPPGSRSTSWALYALGSTDLANRSTERPRGD